ncbi:hypothetical protein EDB83DRAFT_2322276 [Lactarius deliciosus]|nr:hypothetical protein EDB83DRAFT_2322276 [Lactarius deliciosus]
MSPRSVPVLSKEAYLRTSMWIVGALQSVWPSNGASPSPVRSARVDSEEAFNGCRRWCSLTEHLDDTPIEDNLKVGKTQPVKNCSGGARVSKATNSSEGAQFECESRGGTEIDPGPWAFKQAFKSTTSLPHAVTHCSNRQKEWLHRLESGQFRQYRSPEKENLSHILPPSVVYIFTRSRGSQFHRELRDSYCYSDPLQEQNADTFVTDDLFSCVHTRESASKTSSKKEWLLQSLESPLDPPDLIS